MSEKELTVENVIKSGKLFMKVRTIGSEYDIIKTVSIQKKEDIMINTFFDDDIYRYNLEQVYDAVHKQIVTGWHLYVKNKDLEEYPPILDKIAGYNVVFLNNAFSECFKMVKAPDFPKHTVNIDNAFEMCYKLQSVGCMTELEDLISAQWAFTSCTALESISDMPENLTDVHGMFHSCCSLLHAPEFYPNIKKFDYVFYGCSKLIDAKIPSSVKSLSNTFHGCENLIGVDAIPECVENMNSTFMGCKKLIYRCNFKHYKELKYMNCAFYGCNMIDSVENFPPNVENMSNTFANCSNLKSIPENISEKELKEIFPDCKYLDT